MELFQYCSRRFGYLFQLISEHIQILGIFRSIGQFVGVDEERKLNLIRRISFLKMRFLLIQFRIHFFGEEVILQELHRTFGLAGIDSVCSGVAGIVIFQSYDGKATIVPTGIGHNDSIRPFYIHGPCSQRFRLDIGIQRVTFYLISHFTFLGQ